MGNAQTWRSLISKRATAQTASTVGLIALVASPVILIYRQNVGQFSWKLLLLFFIAVAFGILGRVLFEVGWRMAGRKQFHYDYASDIAQWNDAGAIQSFPSKRDMESHGSVG